MEENITETSFFRMCWDNLLSLVGLNLLFFLVCVPIVTMPAGVAALCRACQDIILGKAHPFRCFFRSFKQNFFSVIPYGLIYTGVMGGFLYGCVFYWQAIQDEEVWMVCAILCAIMAYIWFCVGGIGYQIIARVNLRTIDVVRNSFVLLMENPRLVFTWELLSFLVPAITTWFFPRSFPAGLLLSASLSCMAAARGTLGMIRNRLIPE